ncbi:MAG: CGGC domain-containing protein [Bacteroidales bacterium]|jgi:predicted metal-binding protein|nr:CGGC domain-containing protein [Bacteroidales bacterium]
MKIGIIICDRYKNCAGGKCFKAITNRDGAFNIYSKDEPLEVVGYTTCGGCPGGNVEYVPEEMMKNGAEVIHFATGVVVGYPPCPNLAHFKNFIQEKFGLRVIIGTHPIPQKYFDLHSKMGSWETLGDMKWEDFIQPTIADEETRIAYN